MEVILLLIATYIGLRLLQVHNIYRLKGLAVLKKSKLDNLVLQALAGAI
jgi:hypothetical protein